MAKIILTNGVLNVEEDFETILETKRIGDWIRLIESDQERRITDKAMGIDRNYEVIVNINHIQCIKP